MTRSGKPMRIHHLNCGTMCPRGARFINGRGSAFSRARMVCHCLLVETDDGLSLVDTGMGTADIDEPARRLGRPFVTFFNPLLDREETALARIEALGFQRHDVRHLLPTHLDLDHAGGLSDFPDAKVHLYEHEYNAALWPRTVNEKLRYRASQWAHGPKFEVHALGGDKWFGFDSVRAVGGTSDEILIVPLTGHTRGHSGIAVKTGAGWILHAGDAYFSHEEIHGDPRACPPALRAFQTAMQLDGIARHANQRRLRELVRDEGHAVRVFSAHDPDELEQALDASS
jgi:glyoxylase-like metal-dependent hydrolase (beta-lactamase superfamily II)